ISTYLPILALFVLVILSRLQHETQSTVPRADHGRFPRVDRTDLREHCPTSSPSRAHAIIDHRVMGILAAGLLLVMTGCATPYVVAAKAASSHLTPTAWTKDQLLKDELRKAILADQALSGLSITPYVYMQHGFLVGFVKDAQQAAAVTRAAQGVAGLRSLETYLPIKGEPPKDSSGSTLSDLELVGKIKLALKVDEHLVESRYGVEVLDGHVVLLGVVISDDEKLAVTRAAEGVTGVTGTKTYLLQVEQGYGKRLTRSKSIVLR
ncbi:MAG TPA: BON domain-containing protein, partial [Nitrospira sp.]|nr:BON domain-containing protein [Nitrospira sp.]